MNSVLNEVRRLRGGITTVIDHSNSNRYCIVTEENDGSKTAYCFAVPIYNNRSKRLVDLRFYKNGRTWSACGSGAVIYVTDEIFMEDEYGHCKVRLPETVTHVSENSVKYGNAEIFPTLNGILVRASCMAHRPFDVSLLSGQPFMSVRANDRCFSLMSEEFKPHITVSCIGVLNSAGQMIAPCRLEYRKNSEREYSLTMTHASPYGVTLLFEIDLHAEKLFQDTTVESLHPDVNNAFGGTAFIGNTAAYGEQWLYSRTDFSKISELYDKQIRKALLHLPSFGGYGAFTAYGLSARFCSFGSNWENKVRAAYEMADAVSSCGYQNLDITSLITDSTQSLKHSEGLILKPKVKGGGFSAVSTGDSYFAPQILEVNFR